MLFEHEWPPCSRSPSLPTRAHNVHCVTRVRCVNPFMHYHCIRFSFFVFFFSYLIFFPLSCTVFEEMEPHRVNDSRRAVLPSDRCNNARATRGFAGTRWLSLRNVLRRTAARCVMFRTTIEQYGACRALAVASLSGKITAVETVGCWCARGRRRRRRRHNAISSTPFTSWRRRPPPARLNRKPWAVCARRRDPPKCDVFTVDRSVRGTTCSPSRRVASVSTPPSLSYRPLLRIPFRNTRIPFLLPWKRYDYVCHWSSAVLLPYWKNGVPIAIHVLVYIYKYKT